MEKIKIIDLLNKIANGEEVPEKIKLNGYIYEYQGDDYLFKDEDKKEYWLFSAGYTDKFEWLESFLKTEIQIIEEDKKIRNLKTYYDNQTEAYYFYDDGNKPNNCLVEDESTQLLIDKINEIIDKLNEEKE